MVARDGDEGRQQDARAREHAQREFERPIVLEAGAGTGKTSVLTARVLAWSIGPGWERARAALESPAQRVGRVAPSAQRIAERTLGRIAAITFTEAAAAEMATRIERDLGVVAAGSLPPGLDDEVLPAESEERRLRARALRGALDHLVVRTIHAWCRRLLAQFPLAAGLHPEFQVDASGRVQADIVQEVLERQLRDAYSRAQPSPLLELAAQEQGPSKLFAGLSLLVNDGVRAEDLAGDPLQTERVAEWVAELRAAAAAFAALCEGAAFAKGLPQRLALGARATAARLDDPGALTERDLEKLCQEVRELWEKSEWATLGNWARESVSQKGVKDDLGDRLPELCAAAARLRVPLGTGRRLLPGRLVAAQRALHDLLGEVEDRMRAAGAVTFSALLRGARDLLRDHPKIAEVVRGELDQLLVDEFQDTDGTQCELVQTIALQGEVEERPGLFVVGDPKQSIYGWRSADLASYQRFVDGAIEAGGRRLRLCVNFRSIPAILDEVERVLAPVMIEDVGVQPAFQGLLPCDSKAEEAGFDEAGAAPVEHWVSWRAGEGDRTLARTRGSDANRLEARAFARDVRRLRDEAGVRLRDIALLTRSRADLDLYLEALREQDLPYVVAGERSYYRRREVVEATAALRCVLDPNDHLALLAFLRSSVVGVPDAALIPLWALDLPRRAGLLYGGDASCATELEALRRETAEIAAELATALPPVAGIERIAGWEHNLGAGLAAIAALRESFDADPPDRFVELLREALLAEVGEAARYPAPFRVGNLERFYRDLAQELASGASEQAVLRRLRTAGDREREADEPIAAVEDAVQVLTIHGAKGLGFEHVYLAQTHKRRVEGRARDAVLPAALVAATDSRHPQFGEVGVEYSLFGTQTLGFARASALRDRVEAAEHVRTLYVALTRAKRRLVVMGSAPKDGATPRAGAERSHAELLMARVQRPPDLAERLAQLEAKGAPSFEDDARVRWSFLALRAEGAGSARAVEREPIDAAAVARESQSIASARASAAERMRRPLNSAASHQSHSALRDRAAEQHFEAAHGTASGGGLERKDAMAVGTAVHALLEDWDLDAGPVAELERQRARLPAALVAAGAGSSGGVGEAMLTEAERILDSFASSPLFARFTGLADRLVARELPVWCAPELREAEEGSAAEVAPIFGVAGAIDLVYRDETGAFVVVDYKSDVVDDDAALEERCALYAPQGRVYVQALQQGLGLGAAPRFELWFLRAGRAVEVTL